MKKATGRFRIFFQKLLSFLRVRATAAGLEIGDRVVRLVLFDGKAWQMHAVRLDAGVVEGGKIKDRAALTTALVALKTQAGKAAKKKKMNVVVCISSLQMYTQVFSLPMVQGENFEEAVQLNLQMVSPLDAAESHAGWEIVGRDEGTLKTEVLAAFVEKKAVDEMVDTIFEAGFLAMALESRALALTRILRAKGAGVDPSKSYLLIDIDNTGIDFLVIRNGALYFEYSTQWKDLVDDKGDIAIAAFQVALANSLRQVLNFYGQHWKDPLGAIILSAVALEAEAEKAMAENSPLPVVKLTLVMGQPISSEWLVALGCSLRGTGEGIRDREINLLGEDSKDRFREEQLLSFLRFWRTMVPVSLAILVLTFGIAYFFLSSTRAGLETRSDLTLPPGEGAEVTSLKAQASSFNQEVALLAAAEQSQVPKAPFLNTIIQVAATSQITINSVSFQSFNSSISFSGSAVSEDRVLNFKTALENDPRFSNINLPLTAIQATGNTVSFTMSFMFTPSGTH